MNEAVTMNESHTTYFKTGEGIWVITGRNFKDVIHKAKELMW